jgi:hypothetical protein
MFKVVLIFFKIFSEGRSIFSLIKTRKSIQFILRNFAIQKNHFKWKIFYTLFWFALHIDWKINFNCTSYDHSTKSKIAFNVSHFFITKFWHTEMGQLRMMTKIKILVFMNNYFTFFISHSSAVIFFRSLRQRNCRLKSTKNWYFLSSQILFSCVNLHFSKWNEI